jgi:hypothetical protein
MNYPAASHGVSKAKKMQKSFKASFGAWTCGAIRPELYSSHIEGQIADRLLSRVFTRDKDDLSLPVFLS